MRSLILIRGKADQGTVPNANRTEAEVPSSHPEWDYSSAAPVFTEPAPPSRTNGVSLMSALGTDPNMGNRHPCAFIYK